MHIFKCYFHLTSDLPTSRWKLVRLGHRYHISQIKYHLVAILVCSSHAYLSLCLPSLLNWLVPVNSSRLTLCTFLLVTEKIEDNISSHSCTWIFIWNFLNIYWTSHGLLWTLMGSPPAQCCCERQNWMGILSSMLCTQWPYYCGPHHCYTNSSHC